MKFIKERLNEIITEAIKKVILEGRQKMIYEGVLSEMGKVNIHPQGNEEILPYPRFKVFVNNGDHNPPHIHVATKDGSYHATFRIDNGELCQLKSKKKVDVEIHNFCLREVPKWLKERTIVRNKTNQEYCLEEWVKENPDLEIVWSV